MQSNGWLLNLYTREQYPLKGRPDTLPSYEKIVFYAGDTCHISNSLNVYNMTIYSLTNNDNTYLFSLGNVYHIIQLDNNIFKVETNKNAVGSLTDSFHFVRTYIRQ